MIEKSARTEKGREGRVESRQKEIGEGAERENRR